jgi:AraC-like DNA-binding protein
MAIEDVLRQLDILPLSIELGEVQLKEKIDQEKLVPFQNAINQLGFELLDDKNAKLIEKTKTAINELVHKSNAALKTNLSDYLSHKVDYEYNSLSHLFSELEGITIEKYFILHKIERVKELLVYDELSLKEIAFLLNYSSLPHLSAQFKSVTGFAPREFRKLFGNNRKSLDSL